MELTCLALVKLQLTSFFQSICEVLIQNACALGHVDQAEAVAVFMRENVMSFKLHTFSHLIGGYVRARLE